MPDSALVNLLRRAGFRGQGLATAEAVMAAESRGNPRAHNNNTATGDDSYGLFQINMLGGMGPERRARYGLGSNDALYDPLTNAKVAFQLSNGGRDWSPWSTFKSGAYKKYLGSAPPNVSAVQQPRSRLAALAARPGNPGAGGLTEGQIVALLGARQAVGLPASASFLQLLARPTATPSTPATPAAPSTGQTGSRPEPLNLAADAAIAGVDPGLVNAAAALSQALGGRVTVTSGLRNRAQQSRLYQRYLAGGTIAAKPGRSNHEAGAALDLAYNGIPIGQTPAARLLRRYGLQLPVPGDAPHVTRIGVNG